jgi:hypothetical protein
MAVGFTMALAILGMVLRSGFVTREKMKIQQSSDFAALVAADVQRNYLNVIRDINKEIDLEFKIAYTAVQLPACGPLLIGSAAGTINAANVLSTAHFLPPVIKPDPPDPPDPCNAPCAQWDRTYRNYIVSGFAARQSLMAGAIQVILEKANEKAFDNVLQTILTPQNLPYGLQRVLEKKYNGNVTRDAVVQDYNSGGLSDTYTVIDANRSIPLFPAKMEMRIFDWITYRYQLSGTLATGVCLGAIRSGIGGAVAMGKVVKAGDYETSFLTGAQYTSPLTGTETTTAQGEQKKFSIFAKQADTKSEEYGKEIRDMRGMKIPLFPDRTTLTAISLAKPYGGTFPKAGNPVVPLDAGDVGDEFQGAKLIGIADKAQIGGVDLGVAGDLGTQDAEGRMTDTSRFSTEDFLH